MSSSAGAIYVKSSDANEVVVVVEKRVNEKDADEAQKLLDEIEVDLSHAGDDVRVDARMYRSRRYRGMPLRFTLTVPRKYNLDLDTEGGTVEIGDLDGDVVTRTPGGDIDAGKITGEVEVRTAGGRIDIESGGTRIEANTAGGSIEIGDAAGNVDATTAGGSITLGPSAGDVDLKTAGGSLRIEKANGPIEARTSGGSIEAELIA